jgi:hypothetical protein
MHQAFTHITHTFVLQRPLPADITGPQPTCRRVLLSWPRDAKPHSSIPHGCSDTFVAILPLITGITADN